MEQTKALLAAEIIHILEEEGLSVRAAEKRSGVPYTDFSVSATSIWTAFPLTG